MVPDFLMIKKRSWEQQTGSTVCLFVTNFEYIEIQHSLVWYSEIGSEFSGHHLFIAISIPWAVNSRKQWDIFFKVLIAYLHARVEQLMDPLNALRGQKKTDVPCSNVYLAA